MEKLLKQVTDYLESKIPGVLKSTRDEIAVFLIHRFIIHEADAIEKVNQEWKKVLLRDKVDKLRCEIARTSVCPVRLGEVKNEDALQ